MLKNIFSLEKHLEMLDEIEHFLMHTGSYKTNKNTNEILMNIN